MKRSCKIEGCHNLARKLGMCNAHYGRQWRHGDPLAGGTFIGTPMHWLQDHVAHEGADCLTWPFSYDGRGYGQIRYQGRTSRPHRVMCILAHGLPPTPEHNACHSCGRGNEACVNPRHLKWATVSENMMDRVVRGTANRGTRNGQAKLTDATVRAIRQRYIVGGVLMRELATEYGVSRTQVGTIIAEKQWGWLK